MGVPMDSLWITFFLDTLGLVVLRTHDGSSDMDKYFLLDKTEPPGKIFLSTGSRNFHAKPSIISLFNKTSYEWLRDLPRSASSWLFPPEECSERAGASTRAEVSERVFSFRADFFSFLVVDNLWIKRGLTREEPWLRYFRSIIRAAVLAAVMQGATRPLSQIVIVSVGVRFMVWAPRSPGRTEKYSRTMRF